MNCNDTRKYFYAFLDGELDVEKNVEVLAHLDMCYECSLKIERERLIQKRVKETVCMVNAPAYLEHKILRSVERKPNFFALFKKSLLLKNRLIPLIGVATAIILIVSFFTIQNNLKRQAALKASRGNLLLTLADSKYHDYVKKQIDLDLRSQDANEIVAYFQNQAGLSVALPGIKEDVQLVGAILSEINGIKAPLVFCMHDDTPIVLLIACNSEIDFAKMKEVLADKLVVYAATAACGHCQIIGWKEADTQYVMVSKLSSEKLIGLLTKV